MVSEILLGLGLAFLLLIVFFLVFAGILYFFASMIFASITFGQCLGVVGVLWVISLFLKPSVSIKK